MSNREYIIYICMVQKYTLKAHALHCIAQKIYMMVKKGKVFPYSLLSVGPGADPGVQAVSPQVT